MASRNRGRKSVKKGVGLTIMVCGASGTGRTTFVNTLCESAVLSHKELDTPENAHLEEKIKIKPVQVELEEDGVRIVLTIVDTPGFGDNIDNSDCFNEILSYLEREFDEILAQQSRIKRDPRFKDNRVHAVIYFIPPTGHALREMDIELMRQISSRANVIPVIGRSDSLTPSELKAFKKRIMEDIDYYQIPIYSFPFDLEEDDEETIEENQALRALLPFAIVGSEEEIEINGEPVRVRRYPWGVVEIDNPLHTDFTALRSALFGTHLTELKEISNDYLFENYRTEKLSKVANLDSNPSMHPEDLVSQSVHLKEDQLRKEEEKLKEMEIRVQREIAERRQELLAKEESLRNLESRLAAQSVTEF
ncbi:GTP binding protein [Mrakia frigida]|uniref:septin family protein n=1 Tax=Mrakia frigida TaxID=29902 RepID=UPI003FCBF89A